MATATVETEGRFKGWEVGIAAGIAAAVMIAVLVALFCVSGLFDATKTDTTTTQPGEDGKPTSVRVVTDSNELASAQFAIAALAVIGSLTLVAGGSVGLLELTTERKEAGVEDAPVVEGLVAGGVSATAVAALLAAMGELAKGLGEAVKGLKTSAALVLMGALMLLMSGAIAWQTIPGTDKNPTVDITESTTSTTGPDTNTTSTTLDTTSTSAVTTTTRVARTTTTQGVTTTIGPTPSSTLRPLG